MKLPSKIYFHVSQTPKDGWLIREAFFHETGSLETLLSEIDEDTVGVILLEDGIETEASEEVAIAWLKAHEDECDIDENGDLDVSDFIRNHANDLVTDLEGRIAVERLNNRQHNEHHFAGAS